MTKVLNSDLDEVAFCKSRKINLDWFRQKLCDAERQDHLEHREMVLDLTITIFSLYINGSP